MVKNLLEGIINKFVTAELAKLTPPIADFSFPSEANIKNMLDSIWNSIPASVKA